MKLLLATLLLGTLTIAATTLATRLYLDAALAERNASIARWEADQCFAAVAEAHARAELAIAKAERIAADSRERVRVCGGGV